MKKTERCVKIKLVLWVLFILCLFHSRLVAEQKRAWTAKDSVAVRYFLSPSGIHYAGLSNAGVTPSPNGEYFLFLFRHGDRETDSNIYELHIYKANVVSVWLSGGAKEPVPSPYRKVTIRTYASEEGEPAISGVRWEDDSRALFFLGTTKDGSRQVHRLELMSGAVEQLTHHPHRIDWWTARGKTVLYKDIVPFVPPPPAYPMEPDKRVEEGDMLKSGWGNSILWKNMRYLLATKTLYASFRATSLKKIDNIELVGNSEISPNGRFVVANLFNRFVIVDLQHGSRSTMLEAPIGPVYLARGAQLLPNALWSRNGDHIVLVNTAISESDKTSYIVDYHLSTHKWKVLEPAIGTAISEGQATLPSYVSSVNWLDNGEELLVSHRVNGRPSEGTVYTFTPFGVEHRTVNPN